jgi:hypothetical protein
MKACANSVDETGMRALSIRQPYAELILRGEKTIEYRSRPTRIIGERFYIYVPLKWGVTTCNLQGREGAAAIGIADVHAPAAARDSFQTGVIVGTAVISRVTNGGVGAMAYEWHLADVQRLETPRRPSRQPQPVWFRPF